MSAFATEVRRVLRELGAGEVVTYGEVAREAGFEGAARAVGTLLANAQGDDLPWWRVVTATGRLVPGSEARQAALLASEGVRIEQCRVANGIATTSSHSDG